MKLKIIISTIDTKNCDKLASDLVNNHLAACVNMVSSVKSVYVWEGKVCRDEEVILIIKTTSEKLDRCFDFIKDNHPYEVPEIVVLDTEKVLDSYLSWVIDMCK